MDVAPRASRPTRGEAGLRSKDAARASVPSTERASPSVASTDAQPPLVCPPGTRFAAVDGVLPDAAGRFSTGSVLPEALIDGRAMGSSIAGLCTPLSPGSAAALPPERWPSTGPSSAKRRLTFYTASVESSKERPAAVQKPDLGEGSGNPTNIPARACPSSTPILAPCVALGFGRAPLRAPRVGGTSR